MNRFNILKGTPPIPPIKIEPVPDEKKDREITPVSENQVLVPSGGELYSDVPEGGLRIFTPPNFYCPQCGSHSQQSVNIHFDGHNSSLNGDYCMACFARWVSQNTPRLIRE